MMACRDFEADLLAAIPDPRSRVNVIATLERWRGMSIYLRSRPEKFRRIQAAANMLANGMDGPEIADALRKRFRISDRTARRDVQRARGQSW